MKNIVIIIYRFVFCRKFFFLINSHIYKLALRGIGVLNSEGSLITGETALFKLLKFNISLNIIFDVGANTGNYTKEVSEYFPKSTIYAFEPHPKTYKILSKVEKKNLIHTYNYAVGAKSEKVTLWDFAKDADLKHTQPTSTLASLQKDVIEKFHTQKSQGFRVDQISLDQFAKREKINQIDFLKIDTEGSEYNVLRGSANLIKKNKLKIIQFEFNEMNVYSRVFFRDFLNILPNHKFFRLMSDGLVPLGSYKPVLHEVFAFQNIVAIPKNYTDLLSKINS